MNENIDLTKILKNCPKGWKFWSPIFGDVSFHSIIHEEKRVYVISKTDEKWYINADATITLYNITSIEIMLYPSKNQRDWSKFTAPWLEKQGDSLQVNDRAWLYLVSDVLTWKDGVGQYLDNPRVQELAKRLCSEYAQKLYNHSVLSNSSNNGKNEQKSDDKVEPKFKVGDWIISSVLGTARIIGVNNSNKYQLEYIDGKQKFSSIDYVNYAYDKWTIQDAKDGDVLVHSSFMFDDFIFIYNNTSILQAYCYYSSERNRFIIEDRGHHCPWNMQEVTPATKEQRDVLMKAMNDAGYEWDAEKKELNTKKINLKK